ncbi:hypothetical protein PILCRDRAFT_821241 [Piloderma croceum F 1598]|uniref:Uncharacterized protein n=1 Tax=Piloderma croceum (strain F 1598) TaxID=765440 RepID=A0A0C3FB37_PILCF|nr:hypothetical protein PILCRDRAFT_493297 [Piloderma croceum F 1598]KIM81882.1 hypothetical protein PILCRDRAFT_821241 [Piloderma croceum F 1598]
MPLRNPFTSSSRTSVNTQSGSTHAQSTQPSTYTSNVTQAPTYAPKAPGTTHSNNTHRRNESFTMPAAPLRIGSINDIDIESESTITDLLSTEDTSSAETSRPEGPRYIYYRVYTANRATRSVNPTTDDPYLGRISAENIPPPHTVQSLKRCISSSEYIECGTRTQLFLTVSSQIPMKDNCRVSIPGPGCTPNEPMALVLACEFRQYSERMRVVKVYFNGDFGWLGTMEGETLYTEKVVQYERWVTKVPFTYRYFEGKWPAYRAINAAGQEGLVWKNSLERY